MIFGFLGPNGAGKTTTVRLLLGLLEPSSGRAQVMGLDTRTQAEEIRERTGALLEPAGLYERLSAVDNLEFFGRIWRLSSSERQARIRELLTHLGLWERKREIVGTWSRGMKQKLAVARALLHRPALIFLDEPTAGLDPLAAAALREDLAALATREGAAVFLTTHNLAEAEKLCGLVGIIRQGKLIAVGHPNELRARSGALQVAIVGRGFDERVLALLRVQPEVATANTQNGRLLIELKQQSDVAPLVKLIVNAGGATGLLIMFLVFGVFMPLQMGRAWVQSPTMLLYWLWVPLVLVSGVVADSFAGERERHTLEALLATRLSDRAILFGKLGAALLYGWGVTLVCLVLGLVTVNLAHGQGWLLLYPANVGWGILALSLLGAGLVASAGVLISLWAASVRQAQQTLSIAIMLLLFVPLFGVQALPFAWKRQLAEVLAAADVTSVVLTAVAVLVVLNIGLLIAVVSRFKRARLILS